MNIRARLIDIGLVGALALSLVTAGRPGDGPGIAVAAANAGQLTVVLPGGGTPVEGGGKTAFTLTFPVGSVAACSGDSANGGYRVQSFMIPASENPAALTFDASGPLPPATGSTYRQPLWQPTSGGVPYVDQLTGLATQSGGPGPLPTPPNFSFSVWASEGAATIPEGSYTIGIACTLGTASATQLDKYWTATLVITHDSGDQTGLHWAAGSGSAPTTTTTTTVAPTSTTTTTVAGATTTTTTVAGATTTSTTVAGATTTSTTVASAGLGNVQVGGTVTVTGSGFTAGESVKIVLHSDPVLLTTVQASASGQVSSPVTIPAGTPTGAHQIELVGQTSAHSVMLNVTVVAAASTSSTVATGSGSGSGSQSNAVSQSSGSSQSLANTGGHPWPFATWAILLLVLGRMVMLAARHPRVVPSDDR